MFDWLWKLRNWWKKLWNGGLESAGVLAAKDRGPPRKDFYADDYDVMKPIGQLWPTPKFGGPALVWHLALWPDEEKDPQNVIPTGRNEDHLVVGERGRP